MRFFQNVAEALSEIERDMVEMGVNVWTKSVQNQNIEQNDQFQSKEMVGYSFRINDANIDESIRAAAKHHKEPEDVVGRYCVQEFRDRITLPPKNPGEAYKIRPEVWEQYLVQNNIRHGKNFDYTYGERMAPIVDLFLNTLKNDPASRQAVLSVWRPLDLAHAGGKTRIPCSLNYQAMIRPAGDKFVIHVLYTMRSCDLYTHFGFDITLAIMFGHFVNMNLPKPVQGINLTMFIGSLHAFRKDYEPRGIF